jgi:GH25 family lysozyme M1 (1,4-beta-N-acetylmuramidase)
MRSYLKSLFLWLAIPVLAASVVFAPTASASEKVFAHSDCKTWVRIVDISSNNPHPINWRLLSQSGVSGIYIKNSDGDNYVNPYFASDTSNAEKVGIPYGGYDYAEPGRSSAAASARWFVEHDGADGTLPPALDLEVNQLSGAASAQWAITWFDVVKSLTGRTPILYTGGYYAWTAYPSLAIMRLWLAAYPDGYRHVTGGVCSLTEPHTPASWSSTGWSIWQWTSVGYVGGITGNVDISAAEPVWWAEVTGAGVKPPTPGQNRWPASIYGYGSHGVKVTYIQNVLIHFHLLPKGSADGFYGLQTAAAVAKYQTIIGVPADGIWSSQTDHANGWYLTHGRPYPLPVNYPLLSIGSTNHSKVRVMQNLLDNHGAGIALDGVFGPKTLAKLRSFQKSHHLSVTSTTTYSTWVALWKP